MRGPIAVFIALFVACRPSITSPEPEKPHPSVAMLAPTAAPRDPPPPPRQEPAAVEQVEVPGDSPASLVRGAPGKAPHVVFMPGLCSNAYAYLLSFPEAARAHGGVVAIDGDQPRPGVKGFHSFSWDPALQRARIEKALAAAAVPLPKSGLTLVGYSAGASIAELMHQRWPEMFPKLILIAPPVDPKAERLRTAHAVVAMSCSYDVPWRMKAAARALDDLRVPATYLEMPKCTHGNIADGERTFDEAFAFVDAEP